MNRQPYEGLLHKYTNVVKGWQFRWFVLNYDRGILEYHVNEDSKKHKARGSIHLAGAVISPSDEDSQTFTVNSASGDVYKLRAADARERQQWVNKLRSVAEYHTQVIAETNPPLPSHEQRYGGGASPAPSPQESQASLLRAQQRVMYSTATLYDAFSSVREALMQVELNQGSLSRSIEALPSSGTSLKCTDPDLLILKATSQATLLCMEQCLSILQQQQQAASFQQTGVTGGATTEWIEPRSQFSKLAVPSTPVSTISTSQNKSPSETLTSLPENIVIPDVQVNTVADFPPENAVDDDDDEDEVPDSENRDESELGPVEEHKSVILSILSQLKLGMDLTRVVLPTFILESRSLLEMFADYLGHPDLFIRIPDGVTPEERMMSMVEWYLTSFHVGRKGDIAKKPYNPIIGETFTCSWHLPKDDRGDVQTATKIRYISEQVSHHPPVSAFYVECPEKNICMNAHVWTKSKFMGMSIGVNMVGEVVLYLGSHNEEYTFSLPSAFARSILTIPWVELGGKIAIACPKTGCSALVIFHTKTFYGGKLHKVTAEVKNPSNSTICKVQGEWNGTLEFTYSDGTSKIIDTNKLKLYRKYVRQIDKQSPNESRKLWYHVTTSLREGDMKRTTTHKHFLEEKQRQEEKERLVKKEVFPTKHFKPYGEKWFYKNMLISKAKMNNPS